MQMMRHSGWIEVEVLVSLVQEETWNETLGRVMYGVRFGCGVGEMGQCD